MMTGKQLTLQFKQCTLKTPHITLQGKNTENWLTLQI